MQKFKKKLALDKFRYDIGTMSQDNDYISPPGNLIGTIMENSLHASLKEWYAQPGDLFETPIGNYIIDIVREDILVEIQTRNFSSIRKKLLALTKDHPVRLVAPISSHKWILKKHSSGVVVKRKSPKKGRIEDIFYELVRISPLLLNQNFSLEVLTISEEEIQVQDFLTNRRSSWRRKGWAIADRRLVSVLDTRTFLTLEDYRFFLDKMPESLPFNSQDLAHSLNIPVRLSQKMIYCFRETGLIKMIGTKNRFRQYLVTG